MRLRVPLPIKVLLSYLAVLAAGGLPTFFWLQVMLPEHLATQAGHHLAAEARAIANVHVAPALAEGGLALKREELRRAAELLGKRLSVIDPVGRVVFESSAAPGRPANEAPEVRALLDGSRPPGAIDINGGASVARDGDRLGAAVKSAGHVVRVGSDSRIIDYELASAQRYFRNTLAGSLTVALLLTFLSVIVVFRPLKKLRETAQEMAEGDLNPQYFRSSFGEVDDASRAMQQLGTELRRRLAGAGSGRAMLAQLVEHVPAPVLIFELKTRAWQGSDGAALLERVVAVNGRARQAFGITGPSAARRCRTMLDDTDFARQVIAAEDEGTPVSIQIPDNGRARAFVLTRPGAMPLYVLLGEVAAADSGFTAPAPQRVVTRSLESLFEDAWGAARGAWDAAEVELSLPSAWPPAQLADVDDRARNAVERTLRGLPEWLAHPGTLCLDVEITSTAAVLVFDGRLEDDARVAVERFIEPLGGRVQLGEEEVKLWLPLA